MFKQFMVLFENLVAMLKTVFPKLFLLAFRSVLNNGFCDVWG